MKRFLLLITVALLSVSMQAQNTVGLLSYAPLEAYPGYNLHFPHNQGTVYLLNNCGEIVHSWPDTSGFRPGNGVILRDNGDLVVCKGRGGASNALIHAGGGGEKIEIRDWDNNILWSYTLNDSTQRFHHDIADLPNGNILAIAWDRRTDTEAIAEGRDTALLRDGHIWPEKILELQPIGTGSATVVWQWNAWDHLVQDYDSTKNNYGVVADHPELINFNYATSGDNPDWMHSNSIDYNADYDQILLSVPTFNEIWIIDHSTTTAQAAGSTGGFSGKGGDLMYRFGNPAAYDQGDSTDMVLFYSHDCHWADKGISAGQPDYNKIMVFNNRAGADFSTVHSLNPVFDTYDWEYPIDTATGTWSQAFDWSYQRPVPQDMYSTGLSSVQRLPNGNTLIDVGRFGYAFEINANEDIVWEYKNPMLGGNPVSQGDTLSINNNIMFRFNRYDTAYTAFAGRDLSAKGYIELNPDTGFCNLILSVDDIIESNNIQLYPNPATDLINVFFNDVIKGETIIEVLNIYGEIVYSSTINNEREIQINSEKFSSGVYFIRVNETAVKKFVKL
ncbi:MAG: T9SS type A sorting domain-containing protein [Bacteroidia bacterium]|nr:T9SS type A sorting domain-containing protein [Bacteroidia bacterium]